MIDERTAIHIEDLNTTINMCTIIINDLIRLYNDNKISKSDIMNIVRDILIELDNHHNLSIERFSIKVSLLMCDIANDIAVDKI